MSTWTKGNRVVMAGCGEAEDPAYQGVVWTCAADSFRQGTQERVFLEGLGSSFMVSCLREATPEDIQKHAARLKESAAATTVYQAVIYGVPGGSCETPDEALADIVEDLATTAKLQLYPDDIKRIIQLHIAALDLPRIPTANLPVTLNLFTTAYQLVVSKTALPVQINDESE